MFQLFPKKTCQINLECENEPIGKCVHISEIHNLKFKRLFCQKDFRKKKSTKKTFRFSIVKASLHPHPFFLGGLPPKAWSSWFDEHDLIHLLRGSVRLSQDLAGTPEFPNAPHETCPLLAVPGCLAFWRPKMEAQETKPKWKPSWRCPRNTCHGWGGQVLFGGVVLVDMILWLKWDEN